MHALPRTGEIHAFADGVCRELGLTGLDVFWIFWGSGLVLEHRRHVRLVGLSLQARWCFVGSRFSFIVKRSI